MSTITGKMHFSLPIRVLDWLEREAQAKGMRRSQFLAYVLTRLMDDEETRRKDGGPLDCPAVTGGDA